MLILKIVATGVNGFAVMNKVHNVKVKTLFLIHSVFMKVLQSVLAFVGESLAL